MNLKKNILFLLTFTFFFYSLIFFVDTFFFEETQEFFGEEEYIDKTLEDFSFLGPVSEEDREKYKDILKNFEEESLGDTSGVYKDEGEDDAEEEKEKNYYFINVIPETEKFEFSPQTLLLQGFLESVYFLPTLDNLIVELYKKTVDVRGKFQKKVIKLFGVGILPRNEFFSVFVHEFGHYLDLYFFVKSQEGQDISSYFYDISWESSKIVRKGQEKKDFVSGYAMTNQYEDFAESFTYYLLHNDDFLEKAEESTFLMQKYSFFHKYLTFGDNLQNHSFSLESERRDYYWDITKISIDEEKFLQFLEK